ncbi:MAG: aminoglycoside phosphotransferase family protein, partial [Chloroflexi bacterium]
MREEPRIAHEILRTCLQEQYGLAPVSIDFLPLGQDMNAGVYRVPSENGTACLLKVKSGAFYPASCLVPRYLYDQGIASVVAPLPTRANDLWVRAGDWTVIVYPYLEGDTGWTGMTDDRWRRAGAIAMRVHDAALPASGFAGLRHETFDPSAYARSMDNVETQLAHSGTDERPSERALRGSFAMYRARIRALLTSLGN